MNENSIGYNPEQVKKIFEALDTYNRSLQNIVCTRYQNGIVVPLCENWFAPEAVTRINKNVDVEKSLNYENYCFYLDVNEKINAAAKRWAESVGDVHVPVPASNEDISSTLDASMARDNKDGFRGLLSDILPDITSKANQFKNDIVTISDAFKSSLRAYAGFVGAEQMEYLLRNVDNGVRMFNSTYDTEIEVFKTEMKTTVENYQSTAKANANLFASGN